MKSFNQILNWLTRRKVLTSALVGALVLMILLTGYIFRQVIFPQKIVNNSVVKDSIKKEVVFRHPLTGQLETEKIALPQVYTVMIDHSSDAWPQAGVNQAFLVIEAPVEGNIPRLEAFFYEGQDIKKIGPIRSARPYFVDWANELDGMYIHVGGSNQALELIANNGTFNFDQFWHGSSFWRDNDTRYAPHNVYTSTKRLEQALDKVRENKKAPKLLYGIWQFGSVNIDDNLEKVDPIISFNQANSYQVKWIFDQKLEKYIRWQGGRIFKTEDNDQITADNVVVIITDIKVIDGVGRKELRTIGRGDAYIFQNGRMIEGKWTKASANQRMRFIKLNGEEIIMKPGKTWVEVIPDYDSLSFKR